MDIQSNMPADVKKHILKIQGDIKTKKAIGQYSQLKTIFTIIREHEAMCRIMKRPEIKEDE